MQQDYYHILGVKKDVSEAEIKKKYRALAKRYHPDSNPGDKEAERIFKEAGAAYGILGDREKRAAYDNELLAEQTGSPVSKKHTAQGTGSSQPVEGVDFSNMSGGFEQFFGFRPGSSPSDADKRKQAKKTKADSLDMTELFERYMGIKK